VTGADAPFMSTRTPSSLNDPDIALPLGKPGRSISILFDKVLSLGFCTVANTPVAPIIAIGSSVGSGADVLQGICCVLPLESPESELPAPGDASCSAPVAVKIGPSGVDPVAQFADDDVIVAVYVNDNVVVVRGDWARIAPVTRTPAPPCPGSCVIA